MERGRPQAVSHGDAPECRPSVAGGGLGACILFVKSLALFIPYVVLWAGIMTVNRYFICCACRYYGDDCPTFGWSYLAPVFPRRADARFNARAAMAEAAETIIIVCLPLLAWVLSAFRVVGAYTMAEHLIVSVYGVLAVAALVVHQTTGCGHCDVAECPWSKAHKNRKAMAR